MTLRIVPPLTPEQEQAAVVQDLSAVKQRIRESLNARLGEDPMVGEALRIAGLAIDRCANEREALILLVSVLTEFPGTHPEPVQSTDPQEVTRDATDSLSGTDEEPAPPRPAG